MINNNIVLELDYFTLDQAREIIYAEMAENREKRIRKTMQKRKQKVKSIIMGMIMTLLAVGFPVAMFLWWLAFGYF